MDTASKHAAQLLDALAAANERLIALARELRSRPLVTTVLHDFDLRSYRTGPLLEAYVEASSPSDDAICYGLQVSWDDSEWTIETYITVNRSAEEYQDMLREFPERRVSALRDVLAALDDAVADLVVASEDIHPRQLAAG